MFVNDSLKNQISFYHLLALVLSLPFDMFYSHLILTSFTIHTLFNLQKGALKLRWRFEVWVLVSVFLVTVIWTVFSPNRGEALNEWGREAYLVLFPVLFSISFFNLKAYRNYLLTAFAVCCTITVLLLYANALRVAHFYHLPISTLFSATFTNHNFSGPIGMHATFFSLQLGLSFIYLLTRLIPKKPLPIQIAYVFCCLVLIAGIIQLCSKSVFAAMFIAVNFAVPLFAMRGPKRNIVFIAGTALSVLCVLGLLRLDIFRERYFNDLETDLSQNQRAATTSSRLARWHQATQLIKTAPLTGHGSGTEIALLKERYFEKKMYTAYLNGLNAHNQYLSFLIKSGVVGLLVYLTAIFYGFKWAVRARNVPFFTFMLLIAIVSLSENLLDVDKGTIFYGFFFSFFVFSSPGELKNPKNPTEGEELFNVIGNQRIEYPVLLKSEQTEAIQRV